MYSTDKIAIIMATYNGEKYISEQIASLLAQSYSKWELFVHDDGSSDKTIEIVNKFASEHADKIHVIQGPTTGGAKNNFFYLMRNVQAPYVMFCDQDDVWCPTKVEKTYNYMIAAEKEIGKNRPIVVFTDLTVVDRNLNVISERMSKSQQLNPKRTSFKENLIQNVVTGCTMMLNSECVEKSIGSLNNIENIIMHDWWITLVAAYYGKVVFVDEALILYRQHGNNAVGTIPITKLNYIKAKMKQGDVVKNSLMLTRAQAKEFANVYNLNNESLCLAYANLDTSNKLKRLMFYFKNRMWKSGLARNIGLIVWG